MVSNYYHFDYTEDLTRLGEDPVRSMGNIVGVYSLSPVRCSELKVLELDTFNTNVSNVGT